MPGRLRTASSPSSTWIAEASYLPSSTACPSPIGASAAAASATTSGDRSVSGRESGPVSVSGVLAVLSDGGVLAGISSATSHPLQVCAHKEGRSRNGRSTNASVYPVRARIRGCRPQGGGVGAPQMPIPGPEVRLRALRGGGVWSPYRPRALRSALSAAQRPGRTSAVGVARTAAVADRARPALPARTVRPEHVDDGDRAVPELLVEAAHDGRARAASSGSPRPSSRCGPSSFPSPNASGVACCATSRPTIASHRENTPCTRTSVPQPWSAISRPIVESSSCGSRSSGCAPDAFGSVRRLGGRNFEAPPDDPPVDVRRRAPGLASERAMLRARSRPPSSWARLLVRLAAPAAPAARRGGSLRRHRGAPCRPPRRCGRRRAAAGTSSATAAVTSTCSAPGDQRGQPLAALGVELGEHVVEDQDRVVAGRAEQVVGRQPQRQRHRPGLAVRGVPLHRQRADHQGQVVAVRPDQGQPPVDLVVAAALDLREQRLRQHGAVRLALGQLERRLVGHGRVGAGRALGHRLVAGGDVRAQVLDQGQPGGEQLGAGAREVGVPDAERGQRALGAAALPAGDARRS